MYVSPKRDNMWSPQSLAEVAENAKELPLGQWFSFDLENLLSSRVLRHNLESSIYEPLSE